MLATLSYVVHAYPAVLGSRTPQVGRDEFSFGPFATFMAGMALLFLAAGINLIVRD